MEIPNTNKPAFDIMPEAKEKILNGVCPMCGNGIEEEDFRDELSKKEFGISGLCQQCQDEVFN